jgi:hypothetical protein
MAALWFCSRRLPETTQRVLSIQRLARIVPIKSANISNDGESWVAFGSRLSTPKSFGGCHPIELPPYKAAPLQALGVRPSGVLRRTRNEAPGEGWDVPEPKQRILTYLLASPPHVFACTQKRTTSE